MTNSNETLYTASDSICSECYVGTREEWKIGNMDAFKSWYGDYVSSTIQEARTDSEKEIVEFEEWLESTLDDALHEAGEDEIEEYERLTT